MGRCQQAANLALLKLKFEAASLSFIASEISSRDSSTRSGSIFLCVSAAFRDSVGSLRYSTESRAALSRNCNQICQKKAKTIWRSSISCPLCCGSNECQQNLENARPECDFKYFSNSSAFYLSGKAQYQSNSQGENLDVCDDLPALWSGRYCLKSAVAPAYSCTGKLMLPIK